MDGQRFDDLTRVLAIGVSRRGVLRGMAGVLATALGLRTVRARAQQVKQPLCHATGDPANPYVVIEVAEPAWETHFGHGDTPYVDCCTDGDCGSGGACCNGTCIDTTVDLSNCGGCGMACTTAVSNATATCAGGVCGFACTGSLTACGETCIDTGTNLANCGGCGVTCTPPANATATCTAGQCGFVCKAGYKRTEDGLGCTLECPCGSYATLVDGSRVCIANGTLPNPRTCCASDTDCTNSNYPICATAISFLGAACPSNPSLGSCVGLTLCE